MSLRWEDERYVRLYTRDTPAWRRLPWQARALLPLLLRVIDRAGILDLGGHGAEGVADLVGLPPEVVEPGMAGLLKDGIAQVNGETLTVRNFIAAQETRQTDAQRKRDQRERDRLKSLEPVTNGHQVSPAVTGGHSVPSLSEPSLTKPFKEPAPRSRKVKPSEPDLFDPAAISDAAAQALCKHFAAEWVRQFKPADGKPPQVEYADVKIARELVKRHGAEGATELVNAYLADHETFLLKKAHRLRHMNADAYRSTVRAGPRKHAEPSTGPSEPENQSGDLR
jgi:hypothetical protein